MDPDLSMAMIRHCLFLLIPIEIVDDILFLNTATSFLGQPLAQPNSPQPCHVTWFALRPAGCGGGLRAAGPGLGVATISFLADTRISSSLRLELQVQVRTKWPRAGRLRVGRVSGSAASPNLRLPVSRQRLTVSPLLRHCGAGRLASEQMSG